MTTLIDRAVIRLSGDDVTGFLQGLVTNNVAGTLPVWAGLLSPQGKCLFYFFVWADGDDLLVDCEDAGADGLIRRLTMYRLRRAITIERDESLAVHWSPDEGEGVADPRHPALGRRWIAPANTPAEGWIGHRLALGVCEGRAELENLLWLETNAGELNGVDFKKGCFVGQENTARMNWRAKVNRRLFVVEGEHDKARATYPELGRSVVHARIDSVPEHALIPDWLKDALPS